MERCGAALILWLLVAGCSGSRSPQSHDLSPSEATLRAVELANEKAHAQWAERPFDVQNQPGLRETANGWRWTGWIGRGVGDLRAEVLFDRDGRNPRVEIDSASTVVVPPQGDPSQPIEIELDPIERPLGPRPPKPPRDR